MGGPRVGADMRLHRSLSTLLVTSLLLACGGKGPGPDDAGTGGGSPADGGAGGGQGGGLAEPCPSTRSEPGVVATSSGAVRGVKQGDVYRWLGVRFAAPPLGGLRWRPPEPATCAPGVRDASAFGPSCPQLQGDGGYVGDEDCLTLNVFAKAGVTNAPVLFWIHGGGNTNGGSSLGYYDGQHLAALKDVVVVTTNYRLGALGFFTHAQLNAESDAGVSGNYGILDQQAALRWVRDNVRAFGGDPARVMVFGESAGGQNTLLHLGAPGSKGLFSAAIIESGGLYSVTLADSMRELEPVVGFSGCSGESDVLACLRGKSAEVLARVPAEAGPLSRGMHYRPAIDGVHLPAHTLDLIEQGRHNAVPVVIGTNADETSRMVARVSTAAEYEAAVRQLYGALANAVLAQYPASRFPSPQRALIAVTTDATWTCPARRIARALSASQTQPVFRYFFTWRSPGVAGSLVGATHGLEIPFVFRTFEAFSAGFMPDAAALALADATQGYWTRLAAAGDVNGGSDPVWPRFPAGGDVALELGAPLAVLNGVRTADCDFIDGLVP